MTFAEISMRIQELLRPYHIYPCIPTLLVLDWIEQGLDAEKQILPVIQETIARKLSAKQPIPTNLKYYDTILKKLTPLAVQTEKQPIDKEAIRNWKIKMGLYV